MNLIFLEQTNSPFQNSRENRVCGWLSLSHKPPLFIHPWQQCKRTRSCEQCSAHAYLAQGESFWNVHTMCVCMCIYIYIPFYIYIYPYLDPYLYLHQDPYLYLYLYIYIYKYVYIHIVISISKSQYILYTNVFNLSIYLSTWRHDDIYPCDLVVISCLWGGVGMGYGVGVGWGGAC